jgi:NADPH-dependent glutamate synthase beta subunit-like oxidoreductase
MSEQHLVVVVGAGPAGIYGTRKLSEAGHRVVLLNRDIKPGGLAEYGIFVDKEKMKTGLRKQFKRILADPKVFYLGHVTVGQNQAVTLDDLKSMGFGAIVVTAGAQGTKKLGIEGEDHPGFTMPRTSSTITIHCHRSASGRSRSAAASRSSAWAMSWSTSPIGCSI